MNNGCGRHSAATTTRVRQHLERALALVREQDEHRVDQVDLQDRRELTNDRLAEPDP